MHSSRLLRTFLYLSLCLNLSALYVCFSEDFDFYEFVFYCSSLERHSNLDIESIQPAANGLAYNTTYIS